MWKILVIISVIWVGFFIWAKIDYKRRTSENNKKKNKPPFRTENDLKEYGKPMQDEHSNKVDFDDAE
ncbi:MAG: hypothetical protein PHS46_01695 [Candidatus Omnitrophica bacterium]|jgi:hypothetical protein|nr:hypothetical protein [Candidatus Omnitrophota bacterium]